ncbi:MAG: hypothetical protein BGO78_06450 [Chloroflexi bacterium 44-23]|nr:MAG: hypothetical protein BGO78_06450 [Chloroflexi bacterium 44-23]
MNLYQKKPLDFVQENPEKMHKTSLFSGDYMMLGLNCLLPGQEHRLHSHSHQDKFYYVLEGEGLFIVGEQTHNAGVGEIIWAPAGVLHSVSNQSQVRLVVLMGMAPILMG